MATQLASFRSKAVTSTTPQQPQRGQRRPYRSPAGLPGEPGGWRIGTSVSVLIHVLVVALLVWPFASGVGPVAWPQGAGGMGRAGGGGGGALADGRRRAETILYVRVVPVAAPAGVVDKPKPKPPIAPIVAQPPKPVPLVAQAVQPAASKSPATGGGSGADNTSGAGPGTGGGVGTGVGAGRGSAVGPGTGGGTQANYPPTPIEMFIPPLPVPSGVKGFHLVAEFDIDEQGKVLSLTFTPTPDRGYNRRLDEVLRSFRFRPGTTPDGRPVRMKTQIRFDL